MINCLLPKESPSRIKQSLQGNNFSLMVFNFMQITFFFDNLFCIFRYFSLKERPVSPQVGANNATISTAQLPSPLANSDSPISAANQGNQNLLGSNTGTPMGVAPPYRAQGKVSSIVSSLVFGLVIPSSQVWHSCLSTPRIRW